MPISMSSFCYSATVQNWMDCYNIIDEPEDGDPDDIYILEYKGSRVVEG